MLDRRLIREDSARVIDGVKAKGVDIDIRRIIALDGEFLETMKQGEELKHERNVKTEEIAKKKRAGEDASDLHAYLKDLSQRIKDLEAKNKDVSEELDRLLLYVPNLPHPSVPVGSDETSNVVVRTVGKSKELFDDIKPHWEIGEALGVLDLEAGRRVTGVYRLSRGRGPFVSRPHRYDARYPHRTGL